MTCKICGGARYINLPHVLPAPSVTEEVSEAVSVDFRYSRYACPECNAPDRLKVRRVELKQHTDLAFFDYCKGEMRRRVRRELAARLTHYIQENLDVFVTETETILKTKPLVEMKWVVGLVTSDSHVPKWEEQLREVVGEDAKREMENVLMVAKEKIANFHVSSELINKNVAMTCLNEALEEVLGGDKNNS